MTFGNNGPFGNNEQPGQSDQNRPQPMNSRFGPQTQSRWNMGGSLNARQFEQRHNRQPQTPIPQAPPPFRQPASQINTQQNVNTSAMQQAMNQFNGFRPQMQTTNSPVAQATNQMNGLAAYQPPPPPVPTPVQAAIQQVSGPQPNVVFGTAPQPNVTPGTAPQPTGVTGTVPQPSPYTGASWRPVEGNPGYETNGSMVRPIAPKVGY